ncbi:WD40 repeat-like protein [Atractiella rhizophila]|nr:WD40 repeat-like protein [Atractiella rhizophila]
MTSDEVNFLVYSYLKDAGFQHSSYSLLHEAQLLPSKENTSVPSGLLNMSIPPGHLVRILQKGLQYLEAEAIYRGEDVSAKPVRLVGYKIPDPPIVPIIPKSLPRFPSPFSNPSDQTSKLNDEGNNIAKPASPSPVAPPSGAVAPTVNEQKEMPPPPVPSYAQAQAQSQSVVATPASKPSSTRSRKDSVSSATGGGGSGVGSKRKVRSRAPSGEGESEEESEVGSSSARKDRDRERERKRKQTEGSGRVRERTATGEGKKKKKASVGRPTPPLPPGSATMKKAKERKSTGGGGKTDEEDMKRDVEPRPVAKFAVTDKERVITLADSFSGQLNNGQWNPAEPELFVAGGADDMVRTWHIPDQSSEGGTDGMETEIDSTAKFKMGGTGRTLVTTLQWNKEGTLIACGRRDGCVSLHTAEGGYFHVYMLYTGYPVTALKWNAAGSRLLTGGGDGNLYLADVVDDPRPSTRQYSSRLVGDAVLDVEFCTDNFFFAAIDKDINLFNITKSSPIRRFKGHTEDVNVIVVDPTHRYLVSGSDDCTVRLWSLSSVSELKSISGDAELVKGEGENEGQAEGEKGFVERNGGVVELLHNGEIQDVVWHKIEGRECVLSLSLDQTCKIWSIEDGSCLRSLKVGGESWREIALSPSDGLYVALPLDDRTVGIYRLADGELLLEYENTGDIMGTYWHPTRRQIALIGSKDDTVVVDISQLYDS